MFFVRRHAPQVAGGGAAPEGVGLGARGLGGGARETHLGLAAPPRPPRQPGRLLSFKGSYFYSSNYFA